MDEYVHFRSFPFKGFTLPPDPSLISPADLLLEPPSLVLSTIWESFPEVPVGSSVKDQGVSWNGRVGDHSHSRCNELVAVSKAKSREPGITTYSVREDALEVS